MKQTIQVENLSKRFGAIQAVNHIDFAVNQGEIFGFLGPNGAGKTTTIRCMTGILHPDTGNVWINEKNVKTHPLKVKEEIGIAPEVANAYVDLSAWRNLLMMGNLYGVPKDSRKKRAHELLEEFNLLSRRDSLVKTFSKGMKKRLILAMALIHQPAVLFLDEPIIGLDVQSQRLIKQRIHALNREGKTIFLTTHDISLASSLCDRVAILREGNIVAIDSPEKLKSRMQKTRSVEISFTSNKINAGMFTKLEMVKSVEKRGDKFRLYTRQPIPLIEQLLTFAEQHEYAILTLQTISPSLEDVFIELTGGNAE